MATKDLLFTEDLRPPTQSLRGFRGTAFRLLRRRWDLQVHNAELMPTRGPVLLASNHVGVLDGPLLVIAAPRMVHALVKQEMFVGRLGLILRASGQIRLERHSIDVGAIRTSVRTLSAGRVVAIYPEGSRGSGTVAHARLGVAYLAMVTGAPVVPVANLGTRAPGQSVTSLPPKGNRIDVVFGEPIPVQRRLWPRRKDEVADLAEQLRLRLAEHVQAAVRQTGHDLPGPAPDSGLDVEERQGPEVGPEAEEAWG